ncbi:hypothetical protein LTR10_001257 [Elasticomyces elasticus]|nr:hypothetical protein LTR10_001257 [Elasticomyces elasticus]KAK4965376.1 hypothetical protein LTR42_012132 [Elasticomyces elasticus]
MAAATQVLGLPELVEIILLGLPTRDLLFAQKVCKTFKGVIDRSKSIQKALFFLPGTADDVNFEPENIHYKMRGQLVLSKVVSNPLLFRKNAYSYDVLYFEPKALRSASQGSAARMLLTQPPDVTTIYSYLNDKELDNVQGETIGNMLKRFPKLDRSMGVKLFPGQR